MAFPASPRAVVTGAASGLGREFCFELARRGARIVASDIDGAGLEETLRKVTDGVRNGSSPEVHAVRCDVSKVADVERLASEADRLLGGVDVLVNNAGVVAGGRVGDVPIADWEWVLGVNLWGVIHGCHVFAPRMRKQRSGHIVNVASSAGLVSFPWWAPYCVSKYGVVALSEALHGELAQEGVTVTVLCPGFFRSGIQKKGRVSADPALVQLMETLMAESSLQADGVARVALAAAEAGKLYALTHADGRWVWRVKRLLPRPFYAVLPRLMHKRAKKMGYEIAI